MSESARDDPVESGALEDEGEGRADRPTPPEHPAESGDLEDEAE